MSFSYYNEMRRLIKIELNCGIELVAEPYLLNEQTLIMDANF